MFRDLYFVILFGGREYPSEDATIIIGLGHDLGSQLKE